MMHGDDRATLDRRQLLELHIQPVGDREGTRGDQRITPAELAPLDAREPERDARARGCARDGAVVHLHRPHAHVVSARSDAQHVPLGNRARPQRPRDDGADAAQGEDAVDEQPRRAAGVTRRHGVGGSAEGGSKQVEPRPGLRADGHDLGAGHELTRLFHRDLERLRVDQIGLRHRDDAALDAEQAQDGEMLERLRSGALRRVDDEQEEVDPGRAGDHRAHEALVAGHVDERQAAPVRQLEWRVAEVDRDPAPLLLGQPVRVLAGQRPHERRLAVVDVPRGADRQRHAIPL